MLKSSVGKKASKKAVKKATKELTAVSKRKQGDDSFPPHA
jgi:hypothetical protein